MLSTYKDTSWHQLNQTWSDSIRYMGAHSDQQLCHQKGDRDILQGISVDLIIMYQLNLGYHQSLDVPVGVPPLSWAFLPSSSSLPLSPWSAEPILLLLLLLLIIIIIIIIIIRTTIIINSIIRIMFITSLSWSSSLFSILVPIITLFIHHSLSSVFYTEFVGLQEVSRVSSLVLPTPLGNGVPSWRLPSDIRRPGNWSFFGNFLELGGTAKLVSCSASIWNVFCNFQAFSGWWMIYFTIFSQEKHHKIWCSSDWEKIHFFWWLRAVLHRCFSVGL